jgi:hypothetical protein
MIMIIVMLCYVDTFYIQWLYSLLIWICLKMKWNDVIMVLMTAMMAGWQAGRMILQFYMKCELGISHRVFA